MSSKRIANINDVARAAGVSVATVSRTINATARVSPEVKRRVEEAVAALGYIPAHAAQVLSRQRNNTLAAIVPTLDYSIFARKIDAFQRRAEERGYNILIAISGFDPRVELEKCSRLIRSGAEGFLLEGGRHSDELYSLLASRKLPYVNTSVYEPGGAHPTIGFDNRAVASLAAEHLLELGHRRFAVISGKAALNDRAADQVEGIRSRLAREGIDLPGHMMIECGFALAEARQVFRRLLSFQDPPTAIICTNDQLAFGCILEAANAGIDIPGDVSVMGFDDLKWAASLTPSLTTIYVPSAEIGHAAADFLIDRMEGTDTPAAREFAAHLIRRESTAPPKAAREATGTDRLLESM